MKIFNHGVLLPPLLPKRTEDAVIQTECLLITVLQYVADGGAIKPGYCFARPTTRRRDKSSGFSATALHHAGCLYRVVFSLIVSGQLDSSVAFLSERLSLPVLY